MQPGHFRRVAKQVAHGRPRDIWKLTHKIADDFDARASTFDLLSELDVAGKVHTPGQPNRERTMRTERAQIVGEMVLMLVAHVDVATCDLCRAPSGEFVGFGVTTMADRLGQGQRSTERAIESLAHSGWLDTWERAELKKDGTHRGHIAVRKLNLDPLLLALGNGTLAWWKQAQRAEYQRRRRTVKPRAAVDVARDALNEHTVQRADRARQEPQTGRQRVEGFSRIGSTLDALQARLAARAGPPKP